MQDRKKYGFELYDVSIARNWLYAWAILMIVFLHTGLIFKSDVVNIIKSNCNYAVEIFFILSGISLYFSYSKKEDPTSFLKRRLRRVLPYYCVFYFIIFFIKNIIQDFNLAQFLLNFSTLDFWFNGLGNAPWFLCGILVVYLSYPLLYHLFFKEYRNKKYYVTVVIVAILFCVYLFMKLFPHLGIFFSRVPAVLIGIALGKVVAEKRVVKWRTIVLLFVAFLLSVYLRKVGQRLLFDIIYQNLLALTLIVLLTLLHKFNQKFLPFLNKLGFLGGFTFEIYMTHEKTQEMLYEFLKLLGVGAFEYSAVWYQLIAIAIALIVSISLGTLVKILYDKMDCRFRKRGLDKKVVLSNDEINDSI